MQIKTCKCVCCSAASSNATWKYPLRRRQEFHSVDFTKQGYKKISPQHIDHFSGILFIMWVQNDTICAHLITEKTQKQCFCLQFPRIYVWKNKSVRSPADIFPLCWLVSCYCHLTPCRLLFRRALASRNNPCVKVRACTPYAHWCFSLKKTFSFLYGAALSYICSGAIDSCHLYLCVSLRRNSVRGAAGWQVSAWMCASRRRRREKWRWGSWGWGGLEGEFARDGACCWFC